MLVAVLPAAHRHRRDENRQFDGEQAHVDAAGDMARQHRHHPSVAIWSFCNERHCKLRDGATAGSPPDARRPLDQLSDGHRVLAAVRASDPTRECSANMVEFGNATLSAVIGVQGFSHGGGRQAVQYRKAGFVKVVARWTPQ